jgi:uncharacterized protein Veg
MIKDILFTLILCFITFISIGSWAEPISVNSGDTIKNVLTTHIGKRVSIKTNSGGEMTGKVISVGKKLTHLGELSGKEFYDAVIVNRNIEAIVVRVK